MSRPFSTCTVYKASLGDENAFNSLIETFKINLAFGSSTQFPCSCDPPCAKPTQEQHDAMNARLQAYFKANPVKSRWDDMMPGAIGHVGPSRLDTVKKDSP
jgi:hypothetical protein